MLLENDCDVTIFPFDVTLEELQEAKVDGVLLSNGPGDPKSLEYLAGEVKRIAEFYPTLGICLGHQLLALAFGGIRCGFLMDTGEQSSGSALA